MKPLVFAILFAVAVIFAVHRISPGPGAAGPRPPEPDAPSGAPASSPSRPSTPASPAGPSATPSGLAASAPEASPFSFGSCRLVPVHGAEVERDGGNAVVMRLPSAEWSCGLKFAPPEGRRSLDLSGGKWLSLDVENLSATRQMRLTMHVGSGGADSEAADHAVANFTKNRSINTGIGLNPGEKGTMRLLLPHPEIYASPEGAPGPFLIDTRHVNSVDLQVQWPFEDEFRYVAECRVSNLRLEGEPDSARAIPAEKFFPFIDRYGQFKHSEWPEKVHSDSELREDLAREEAALARSPRPAAWDRFGGWKDGPRLRATGHFRTENVDGKWWLVTPEGHLFFSTGIDVVRDNADSSDGSKHPDWHETPVPDDRMMSYPAWNLQKKFGRKNYLRDYFDFVQKRLPAWGQNTIGNWAAREILMSARMPYVASVLENAPGVKRHEKFHIYDLEDPDFERNMREAIRRKFAEDTPNGKMLRHAARDPMCIGFFVDNELQFQKWIPAVGGEKAAPLIDLYFRVCKEELQRAAPDKLYLGSRFVGFRQSGLLWNAAAKWCDVVSVNAYANSIANISGKIMDGGVRKPILVGEFHFGCMDRGMFKASLCPVGDQKERARSYARFVEGALRHPLFVGCHWFQYRDQPLIGRGDGEAYECGFVDGTDRPYRELCAKARAVGEKMYQVRFESKVPHGAPRAESKKARRRASDGR